MRQLVYACLLLIIILRFTCGERKICSTIKKPQNIMNMILGLFMSYLCDLFFISTFIFITINRIVSGMQTQLFFCLFFRICPIIFGWIMWIISKQQNFSLECCLAFSWVFANFSLTLLIKVLLIKNKPVVRESINYWKKLTLVL